MIPHHLTVRRAAAEPAAPNTPGDRFRSFVFIFLTALMIGLCIYLAVPFLPALAWGLALVVVAWPVHARICKHVRFPGLAAGISTALVIVVVLLPVLFLSYQLAAEAGAAAKQVKKESEDPVRDVMTQTPGLNQAQFWLERVGVDLTREIRIWIESRMRDSAALLQGSLSAAIQFLVMLFVMYYLFRDSDCFLQMTRSLLPLTKNEGDQVFSGIVGSIHANLYAAVVTASINGLTSGLVFMAVGLPSPVLWATVVFLLTIVPVLGNVLVWAPVTVYLALMSRWWSAAAVLGWGLTSAILVDSLLFVWLAGRGMRMHKLPTMIAYIGGLAVFGMSGLVLGPAILAVAQGLLVVWHERSTSGSMPAPAPTDAGPPPIQPPPTVEQEIVQHVG